MSQDFMSLRKALESDENVSTMSVGRSVHVIAVGSMSFILPSRLTFEVVKDMVKCRLPKGPKFLLGIGHSRGKVFPIFDLNRLLDIKSSSSKYTLLINLNEEDAVVMVINDLPKAVSINDDNRLDSLPELHSLIKPYVKAAYQMDTIYLELDIQSFFNSLSQL